MKVVVAMDSFKGSLSSPEAGEAAAQGVRRVYPDAEVLVRPLADGGEGTVEALASGLGGRMESARVHGPLGEIVDCGYGILPDGTAAIEMSSAAGLTLVPEELRNPMETSTFGVGELIRDAISKGCRRFIVGIGGSATNDGGAGMLQALGFGLLDARGGQISTGAKGLRELARIERGGALPELADCRFRVACDVNIPLCGEDGASAVFGPQKGATPEMVERMDAWLANFARLAAEVIPGVDPTLPGSGAAGGLGFALRSFLNARLESGVRIVLEETRLADFLRGADFALTGEGKLDRQTAMGKAPAGVAQLAKQSGAAVLAFAGGVDMDADALDRAGIDACFPIVRGPISLADAMKPDAARRCLSDTVEQVFRLIRRVRGGE